MSIAEFSDKISKLAERAKSASAHALTEEATKHSIILPFLIALGFDPFDLDEVVPEMVADVGIKKGEKIDYALKIDGEIKLLLETKTAGTTLTDGHLTQLYRYFSVSPARIAILTNGREFRFYSDIDESNKMDVKPFFVFDLDSWSETGLEILAGFRKDVFDIGAILGNANQQRRQKEIRNFLRAQMDEPSDDFVKLAARSAHEGAFIRSVIDEIKPLIKAAFQDVIKESIRGMLDIRNLQPDDRSAIPEAGAVVGSREETRIETTAEELEAFNVVRAICTRAVPPARIHIRDNKSYCSVLFDDNRNKQICRLYFNAKSVKRLHIYDGTRDEKTGASGFQIVELDAIEDIFAYQNEILNAVSIHFSECD